MSRLRTILAGAFLTVLPTVLSAAPAPPLELDVTALDWMAGSWTGNQSGVDSEEHWTHATGGALLGMHKDVRAGRMSSFEYLRIVVEAPGIICYVASPGGAPPTSFCAVEAGTTRVVFENLQHDFPQRILYWLDENDRLHARIEGPGESGPRSKEWVWSRMPN